MPDADARRYWHSQVAPASTLPAAWPHIGPLATSAVSEELFQISFFVNKAGIVSAMPGGGLEAASMFDEAWDDFMPFVSSGGH